jgi:BirA family biotin operon repressor/biotin-[acetyl-CoA-carboxylase] ligase
VKGGAGQRVESLSGDIDRLLLASFLGCSTGFLSGADLSDAVNVSRTTVWKRIETLREYGFVFESVPSRGYRLVDIPDFLHPAAIAAGMSTRRLGRVMVTYPETGSTNAVASRLGEAGAGKGTAWPDLDIAARCESLLFGSPSSPHSTVKRSPANLSFSRCRGSGYQ